MTQRLLVLHCLTPLHVGSGRGEGLIDLPVARDVVDGHPLIPGSGIKGPLRAAVEEPERSAVFGPPHTNAHEYASAVRFSDARLLAMPCASDHGTFALVTSPLVLRRWARDAEGIVPLPTTDPASDNVTVAKDSAILDDTGRAVVLAGQTHAAVTGADWIERIAELVFPNDATWRDLFRRRLAIVPDEVFDAITRTGTDVRAHIRIDENTGTVAKTGLWYEESVPPEAVFVSVVHLVGNLKATPQKAADVLSGIVGDRLTFGGGKTTGMGLVRAVMHGERP